MTTKQVFTLEELRHWEDTAPALDPPAKLAVIGDPIAHSRSPQMHNPALESRGIRAQYIRVHVPVGHVGEALRLFAKHGFTGVNCTIPHKFEALDAVDVLDDLARQLGAVNTVAIREGKLHGYNSDGPGFLYSVKEAFGCGLAGLRVLILGVGGGAGRAVAVQCALARCSKIVLVNRTEEKASLLAAELMRDHFDPTAAIETAPWNDASLKGALRGVDLVVNASPLGMKAVDASLFDPAFICARHMVYDMVYRASGETPLIAAAKTAGAKTCDGLALLLHQGAISFGHWFGEPVPIEEMRRGLLAA